MLMDALPQRRRAITYHSVFAHNDTYCMELLCLAALMRILDKQRINGDMFLKTRLNF
jgi:hypothetical protein